MGFSRLPLLLHGPPPHLLLLPLLLLLLPLTAQCKQTPAVCMYTGRDDWSPGSDWGLTTGGKGGGSQGVDTGGLKGLQGVIVVTPRCSPPPHVWRTPWSAPKWLQAWEWRLRAAMRTQPLLSWLMGTGVWGRGGEEGKDVSLLWRGTAAPPLVDQLPGAASLPAIEEAAWHLAVVAESLPSCSFLHGEPGHSPTPITTPTTPLPVVFSLPPLKYHPSPSLPLPRTLRVGVLGGSPPGCWSPVIDAAVPRLDSPRFARADAKSDQSWQKADRPLRLWWTHARNGAAQISLSVLEGLQKAQGFGEAVNGFENCATD